MTALQGILAVTIAGAAIAYHQAAARRDKVRNAHQALKSELAEASGKAANGLAELSRRPTLVHALQTDLPHILQGELRSALRPGILEAIALISKDCAANIRVAESPLPMPGCEGLLAKLMHRQPQDAGRSGFNLQFSRLPAQGLAKEYWLAGSYRADESWVAARPALRQTLAAASVSLAPAEVAPETLKSSGNWRTEGKTYSIPGGFVGDTTDAVLLQTRDPLLFWLLKAHSAADRYLEAMITALALLSCLAWAVSAWMAATQRRRTAAAARGYAESAGELLGKSMQPEDPTRLDWFQEVLDQVKEHAMARERQYQELRQSSAQLQSLLAESRHQLKQLQVRRQESIFGQADRWVAVRLLAGMQELKRRIGSDNRAHQARIQRLTETNIGPVLSLTRHWRDDIEKRGARKFIRSLDETLSFDGNQSNLEFQLHQIISAHEHLAMELNGINADVAGLRNRRDDDINLLEGLRRLFNKEGIRAGEVAALAQAISAAFAESDALQVIPHILEPETPNAGLLRDAESRSLPLIFYMHGFIATMRRRNHGQYPPKPPVHKIEMQGTFLCHGFFLPIDAAVIRDLQGSKAGNLCWQAASDWIANEGMHLHVIPQRKDACAIVIREQLEVSKNPPSLEAEDPVAPKPGAEAWDRPSQPRPDPLDEGMIGGAIPLGGPGAPGNIPEANQAPSLPH